MYLTPESLECIAIFKTGDVFIYQLEPDGKLKPTDKDVISLDHILTHPPAKYRPVLMIPSGRGPVSAFGASDIGMPVLMVTAWAVAHGLLGFFAFAHTDGSLVVLDMRGPTFILRDTNPGNPRQSFLKHSTVDQFASLSLAVFRLSSGQFGDSYQFLEI